MYRFMYRHQVMYHQVMCRHQVMYHQVMYHQVMYRHQLMHRFILMCLKFDFVPFRQTVVLMEHVYWQIIMILFRLVEPLY